MNALYRVVPHGGRWAVGLAMIVSLALLGMGKPATPIPPEAPPAKVSAEKAPTPATAAAEAPAAAPKPGKKKALTLEEIKELPILKRFELPLEKGEELLKDIKDETFGYDEPAFYYLVDLVHKLPANLMKPDKQMTPYKALLAMPSSYRGSPVTIRGLYLSASPFYPPPIAILKDIPMLYECSIRELPANEVRPLATVITLEDPMTYLHERDVVVVKGYFYKVRKYEWEKRRDSAVEKGASLAPMLIARRLEPETGEIEPFSQAGEQPQWMGGLTGPAIMLALLVLMGAGFFLLRQRTRAKVHAETEHPVHRFRLRRPDWSEPPSPGGPGGEGGGPKP